MLRDELLKRLRADANFGQQRIQELSDFLLDYVRKQLQSNDLDTRDFAQAQQWTVLAYSKPGEAAQEIALAFQKLGLDEAESAQQDKAEIVRIASLVETFSEPLAEAGLEPLLVYARGMASWARGHTQKAAEHLEQVTKNGKIQIAGVNLPIPKEIGLDSEHFSQPRGPDYSSQKLQGRSFREQDLTGANFSNADIRSTDFKNTILISANFSGSQMGLQRRWATGIILFSLQLITLSGFATTLVGCMGWFGLNLALENFPLKNEKIIFTCAGSIGFILFIILCIATLNQKLQPAWVSGALALLGSSLFVGSVIATLVWSWSWVNRDISNFVTIAFGGIALILALVLNRSTTSRIFKRTMVLAGAIVTLFLSTALLMDETNVTLILVLTLIATVIALELIWASKQVKKLSKTFALIGIFAVMIALVTGIVLGINQVGIATAALIVTLTPILVIFLIIPLIIAGIDSVSGAFVGTVVVTTAIAIFFTMDWSEIAIFFTMDWSNSSLSNTWTAAIAIADISILLAAIAWATIITIAIAVNLTWAEANNKTIAIAWTIFGILPPIIGGLVVTLLSIPWLESLIWKPEDFLISASVGIIFAFLIVILGIYIGWRALVKDKKFTSIRNLAIAFAAKGGTSFCGADLTDANFTEANLKSADFREANLTRTCWFHAQKLDHACVENSYLQYPQVQQLVITGIGQDQNFNHLNLQGINLNQANLADASFIGTNLSGANLQHTDLSRAKLIGTKLDQADLFGACLTGAYIQDVKITTATKLKGVECQYIFTRLPTKENRDPGRAPDDYHKIFTPREFIDFMRNLTS
ncbi:MAG: pentapeptide repeat-containing protein [Cyanobacteria bacterium P01_F01_bin.143]